MATNKNKKTKKTATKKTVVDNEAKTPDNPKKTSVEHMPVYSR